MSALLYIALVVLAVVAWTLAGLKHSTQRKRAAARKAVREGRDWEAATWRGR